jgi:hypothetical protein
MQRICAHMNMNSYTMSVCVSTLEINIGGPDQKLNLTGWEFDGL